jgi:hypothetical protein
MKLNIPPPQVGDFASLRDISISYGTLEPAFASEQFEYFVMLSADAVPDMVLRVTASAVHDGAHMALGGTPIKST